MSVFEPCRDVGQSPGVTPEGVQKEDAGIGTDDGENTSEDRPGVWAASTRIIRLI